MHKRPRWIVLPLLAVLASGLLAGCGGGSGKDATSGTDVNSLLRDTFSAQRKITSGKLDLLVRVDASGSQDVKGPVVIRLSGPFQSQGKGKLPKFAMDASLEGGGQSFKAGATSTGDKAFVAFQGTNYAVSDRIFREFKAGYEQAQKRNGANRSVSPATLGIDPRRWLKDARNAGEAKVGDADTIHITGTVDVPKLLDDVNTALSRARSLGLQGTRQLPQQLTAQQKREAVQAIKNVKVDIYTGKADRTLRRITVNLDAAEKGESAKVLLDLSLADLNHDQSIQAPTGAKPLDQLLGQLGGLGGLAAGGGTGSPGASGSSRSGAAANLQKYSQCIEQAGSDAAKARKCADLLTP